MGLSPKDCLSRLPLLKATKLSGKVTKIVGLVAEGAGINAPLGAMCHMMADEEGAKPIPVEVVGFRDGRLLFMPYSDMRGIHPGSSIVNSSLPPIFPVSEETVGRVFDAFGQPLDNKPPISPKWHLPLYAEPPSPLQRPRINEPLNVGVRSINALLTLGKGQRVGIMAGSGVGKSTLMGMMARYTSADINVMALVGERGREVLEFMEKDLGPEGMARSVIIVATSDQSPLIRMRAAYAATAVAEWFRDQGKDVLFMMDSITRFAMAAREVGLAIGEPPTTKGYTPSVFTQLPKLLERTGKTEHGSITGIYTVLVDGDDFNEPIADAVRSILDGHIVLTRDLADQAHFPAIDVLRSISRVRNDIIPAKEKTNGQQILQLLATYRKVEDMVNIGAYTKGANPSIDRAIAMQEPINAFLRQDIHDSCDLNRAFTELAGLAGR